MKGKMILFLLAAAMVLCACQADGEPQDINLDTSTPEQTEQKEPPSDGEAQTEPEEDERDPLPPAPPVCELDFTETESFPFPFEDELLVDEERGLLLSTGQALYDYDTMWQLLEENYPYLEAIKREMGIDWEEVKREYRQRLESHASDGYISQEDFIHTIDVCLKKFQSVGHLFLIKAETRTRYIDGFSSDGRNFCQNLSKLMSNPKSDIFYTYEEQLPSQNPDYYWGDGEIVNVDEWVDISQGQNVYAGYVEGGIPYLRFGSFSLLDDGAQATLEEFFSGISEEEHLIIDVRGNGGGSDYTWRYGIVPFLAQKEYEYDQFWAAKSGSLNLRIEPKFDKSRENFTRYTDDSWQEEFPYVSPDSLTGLDIFLKVSWPSWKTDTPDKFDGKIWVLVDESCYSATDDFVSFCKETGFATLVGTKTGGSGKGTDPYFMALPYSGMIVEYDTYFTFNIDGTINGISGPVPDIVLEPGKYALETCLMAINGELDN